MPGIITEVPGHFRDNLLRNFPSSPQGLLKPLSRNFLTSPPRKDSFASARKNIVLITQKSSESFPARNFPQGSAISQGDLYSSDRKRGEADFSASSPLNKPLILCTYIISDKRESTLSPPSGSEKASRREKSHCRNGSDCLPRSHPGISSGKRNGIPFQALFGSRS